jgi:ABC-2 type transport system ATP-binding protein
MTATLLDVRQVTRRYGKLTAVDELSFAIEGGSIWGFIGPNGAGKTTTMRILATLDVPDSGDALVGGTSVLVDPRLVRTRVGFMSDQFQPYANLDVGQFLDFFARAQGLRGRRRIDTVRSVVAFCHLEGFLDRPASGLSKGMGQRVHLAKTLLHDPALLILDEPASGLDPHARIELRELLEELAANGKGILISSHILSELSEICDGAIVLERGKMVVAGKVGDLAKAQLAHVGTRVSVKALGDAEPALRFFATQPLVDGAGLEGAGGARGEVTFTFAGEEKQLAELLARAVGHGLLIVEFSRQQVDLEDIFLQTTKGRLQ